MTYSKLSFWFGAGEVWQDHGAARKTVCKGDDAKAVVSQTDLFGVAYGRPFFLKFEFRALTGCRRLVKPEYVFRQFTAGNYML